MGSGAQQTGQVTDAGAECRAELATLRQGHGEQARPSAAVWPVVCTCYAAARAPATYLADILVRQVSWGTCCFSRVVDCGMGGKQCASLVSDTV